MLPTHTRLVRFGVFEFDLTSGDLSKAGRRIPLQNQPRQVLKILVARRGELVTREELRRQLWPDDTFVDFDSALNVAVRKIRDAIGDVAPSPRFIETERAQGYRFIAPVTEASPLSDTPDSRRRDVSSLKQPSRKHVVIAAMTLVALTASPRSCVNYASRGRTRARSTVIDRP